MIILRIQISRDPMQSLEIGWFKKIKKKHNVWWCKQELTCDYGYELDSVVGPDGKIKQLPYNCGEADCRKHLYKADGVSAIHGLSYQLPTCWAVRDRSVWLLSLILNDEELLRALIMWIVAYMRMLDIFSLNWWWYEDLKIL